MGRFSISATSFLTYNAESMRKINCDEAKKFDLVDYLASLGHLPTKIRSQDREAAAKDDPSWPQSDEFSDAALTLVLIIEIYTERYPNRVLRFSGDGQIKALLFGTISGRFKYLIETLFTITWERHQTTGIGQEAGCRVFLLRRKPIPYMLVHTVETNWSGVSRVFNNQFKIEVEKSIRVGLMRYNEKRMRLWKINLVDLTALLTAEANYPINKSVGRFGGKLKFAKVRCRLEIGIWCKAHDWGFME